MVVVSSAPDSRWVKEARSSAGPRDQEPNMQVQEAVKEFFNSDFRPDGFLVLEDSSMRMVFGCLVLRPQSYGVRNGASLDLSHP